MMTGLSAETLREWAAQYEDAATMSRDPRVVAEWKERARAMRERARAIEKGAEDAE